MRWASAIATTSRLEDAVDEAAESLAADLDGAAPDLVLAFVTLDYADHFLRLAPCVAEHFPSAALVGCSAGGVIGGSREIEREPALSLTAAALPGVEVTPFHLDGSPEHWRDALGAPTGEEQHVVILPDPFTMRAEDLVQWLDVASPDGVKLGGLASGASHPGGNALFCADRLERAGAVGVALRGDLVVDPVVAQGCRPIGTPMFVTRAADNILFELDGEPALSVLESLHGELSPEDRLLCRHSLFLGLGIQPSQQVYQQGDFLIRNLMGVDAGVGALALGAPVSEAQVVQFHLRDARTSADDLSQLLSRRRDEAPAAGALLFSCLGRGELLYGRANHDSELFQQHLGPVPLGGFFCNGEIGPVQGQTFLHGYTSSFGLFRPRPRC
jgi:small ligand-binding sensory domain FIST